MNKIIGYIRESRNELLNKVSWPTWSELQESGIIVVIATIIFSIVIMLMDEFFGNILKAFYNLFQ